MGRPASPGDRSEPTLGKYESAPDEAAAWLREHAHTGDRARAVAELERGIAAAQTYRLVYRVACDGGPDAWVCDEGALQQGVGEKTPWILGQRREIDSLLRQLDEVTRSEAEARESEQSFRFMVEHSRDVLFRGNYRTLQYEYVSPSMESMSGGFTREH